MRHLLIILPLVFTTASFCQSDEIYKLTFSDTSNFRITTCLDQKRPKKIFIIDTTQQWLARFWLDELDTIAPQKLKELERDEHHPYNTTYLFRDTMLDRLINDTEKKILRQTSARLKPRKISLHGSNYSTVTSSKDLKGFYVITSEPVFSSEGKYAFIDLLIFYKERAKQDANETYFGTTCIVYKKQQDGKWNKIKVRDYLIL
jgi:hypothetical protein